MRVNIYNIPGGICKCVILAAGCAERAVSVLEVPVNGKVDNACAVSLGIVGSVVCNAVEECVCAGFGQVELSKFVLQSEGDVFQLPVQGLSVSFHV